MQRCCKGAGEHHKNWLLRPRRVQLLLCWKPSKGTELMTDSDFITDRDKDGLQVLKEHIRQVDTNERKRLERSEEGDPNWENMEREHGWGSSGGREEGDGGEREGWVTSPTTVCCKQPSPVTTWPCTCLDAHTKVSLYTQRCELTAQEKSLLCGKHTYRWL